MPLLSHTVHPLPLQQLLQTVSLKAFIVAKKVLFKDSLLVYFNGKKPLELLCEWEHA